MMVNVNFATWEEAKKAFYQVNKRLLFDTENLDRMLILEALADDEYDSANVILDVLDNILGGYWIDVIGGNIESNKSNIDVLTKHFEGKKL